MQNKKRQDCQKAISFQESFQIAILTAGIALETTAG